MDNRETKESGGSEAAGQTMPSNVPGLVASFSSAGPTMKAIPLGGKPLVLGRDSLEAMGIPDEYTSRTHAEVSFDGQLWTVRDLDSRNGTYLDGERLVGFKIRKRPAFLRIGHSIFLFNEALEQVQKRPLRMAHECFIGPTLAQALERIASAGAAGECLLIAGETGSGKELASKTFHEAAAPQGPRVVVNCSEIPASIAERLLFGAVKGAYSGAENDADGYLKQADGGTLFLDEVAELDLLVQAKLLRAIESKEVLPLGAARPRRLHFRLCCATNVDMSDSVRKGAFREDLYFRLCQERVRLPPLRERKEEISWLVAKELSRQGVSAHVLLVESCLLHVGRAHENLLKRRIFLLARGGLCPPYPRRRCSFCTTSVTSATPASATRSPTLSKRSSWSCSRPSSVA